MSARRLLCLAMAILLGVPAAAARGQTGIAAAPASKPSVGRPNAGAGPTRVFVTIWIADIDSIDSAAQSYIANVYVALRWNDPRLVHTGDGPRVYDLAAIWNPRVIVANEIGLVRKTLPDIAEVAPEGTVVYRQRYVGPYSQPLQLHDFPFDSHIFRLHLASPGSKPADLEFVAEDRWPNPGGPRFADGAGISDEISLPDWDIVWCRTRALPYVTLPTVQTAGYAMEFQARRHTGYFIWKLLLPLTLIILMSWSVFWIDPSNVGVGVGVATTAMLTLIAYRFAVDQNVPHVGYLTRMDYFVIGSSVLVFLTLCQVLMTAHLAKTDRLVAARRLDAWSRVIFVGLLVALAVVSFVLSK